VVFHPFSYIAAPKVSIDISTADVTFNNISVITWQSVLLVEETAVPEENHRPVASH
jgi:hypothetical protein